MTGCCSSLTASRRASRHSLPQHHGRTQRCGTNVLLGGGERWPNTPRAPEPSWCPPRSLFVSI